MKKEDVNGVDIYIDRGEEMMFVSMNEKMTPEAHKKVKEGLNVLTGYQVMVFESINDIKYLN